MRNTTKPALELIKDSMKKDLNTPLTLENFSFKKTFIGDWKNFFIFILLMFMAWSYFHDTNECRQIIENIDEICLEHVSNINLQNQLNPTILNDGDPWNYNQPDQPSYIP